MTLHTFATEQWLPAPRAQLFAFFADAANLDALTPPWLHFRILTPLPVAMRRDTLIDYRLRVHGLPIRWRTRIAAWEPDTRFVDEQLRGPYRLWVHEHRFQTSGPGTLMRDTVRYAVPLDPILHRRFIRPDIERIFAFRTQALRRRFGA